VRNVSQASGATEINPADIELEVGDQMLGFASIFLGLAGVCVEFLSRLGCGCVAAAVRLRYGCFGSALCRTIRSEFTLCVELDVREVMDV
jgi:hypothetical protein